MTNTDNIYFDANATTPISDWSLNTYLKTSQKFFGNPSSITSSGRAAKNLLNDARGAIAGFFNCNKQEIIFTSGGTESVLSLVSGITKNRSGQIITTKIEHRCVSDSIKDTGKKVHYLDVDSSGLFLLTDLEIALQKETSTIVLSLVNGEIGTLLPYKEIALIAKRYNTPFILDGVAALGKIPIEIVDGITGIAFSGHKCHGPKGSGFFYLQKEICFDPLFKGGKQEMGKRGGTENLPAIAALASAVGELNEEVYNHLKNLRDTFESEVKKIFPDIKINGSEDRVTNTSNIYFPDVDGDHLLIFLDNHNISASLGSACSSGSIEASHVLLETHKSAKYASSCLRFSFHRYNTFEAVSHACSILKKYKKISQPLLIFK